MNTRITLYAPQGRNGQAWFVRETGDWHVADSCPEPGLDAAAKTWCGETIRALERERHAHEREVCQWCRERIFARRK